jgi:hypothetical protein
MADLVNLNRARKARAAAERKAGAAENRILHGRTKAEKTRDALQAEQARKQLDGARRLPPRGEGQG